MRPERISSTKEWVGSAAAGVGSIGLVTTISVREAL